MERRRKMSIQLKDPLGSYQPRLTRFIKLVKQVRNLPPRNLHLWKVMDTVAFQDTETALETVLFNHVADNRKGRKQAND